MLHTSHWPTFPLLVQYVSTSSPQGLKTFPPFASVQLSSISFPATAIVLNKVFLAYWTLSDEVFVFSHFISGYSPRGTLITLLGVLWCTQVHQAACTPSSPPSGSDSGHWFTAIGGHFFHNVQLLTPLLRSALWRATFLGPDLLLWATWTPCLFHQTPTFLCSYNGFKAKLFENGKKEREGNRKRERKNSFILVQMFLPWLYIRTT